VVDVKRVRQGGSCVEAWGLTFGCIINRQSEIGCMIGRCVDHTKSVKLAVKSESLASRVTGDHRSSTGRIPLFAGKQSLSCHGPKSQ
jgi:hypothetical protein